MKVRELINVLHQFEKESVIYLNINDSELVEEFLILETEERLRAKYYEDDNDNSTNFDKWSEAVLFIKTFQG